MAIHSRILAWRIPWTEKPSGLQSIGSQRVRHYWSDLTCRHTHTHTHTHIYIHIYMHTYICIHTHIYTYICMCMCKVTQSYLTLCDPVDCSPPGSSVHGILQARILEWIAMSFSSRSSQPRDRTQVSCIAGRRFILWATGEAIYMYTHTYPHICMCMCEVAQSYMYVGMCVYAYEGG